MKAIKYLCDGCGSERKDANHWFTTFNSEGGGISVEKFDPYDDAGQHYCGERCVIVRVSEFLQQLKNTTVGGGK